MSMFNGISCGTRDNERECLANAKVVSMCAKKFGFGQWSFIGPGSEKKWYTPSKRTVHKESGTRSRRRCWWNSPKAHVQFSVLQPHCPELNSEAKNMENCQFTLLPLRQQLKLFFAYLFLQISSVFTEQSREEYESHHRRSGRPDEVMGQSIVLSEIKTEVP